MVFLKKYLRMQKIIRWLTCGCYLSTLVSKVHREAENLHKAGYHLILIGHQNHPEVIGTMGQLPDGGSIDLIQNEDEAKEI